MLFIVIIHLPLFSLSYGCILLAGVSYEYRYVGRHGGIRHRDGMNGRREMKCSHHVRRYRTILHFFPPPTEFQQGSSYDIVPYSYVRGFAQSPRSCQTGRKGGGREREREREGDRTMEKRKGKSFSPKAKGENQKSIPPPLFPKKRCSCGTSGIVTVPSTSTRTVS